MEYIKRAIWTNLVLATLASVATAQQPWEQSGGKKTSSAPSYDGPYWIGGTDATIQRDGPSSMQPPVWAQGGGNVITQPGGAPNGTVIHTATVQGSDANVDTFWFGVDYLVWWAKYGPNPNPLITTNANSTTQIGAIGEPGTEVLAGGAAGKLRFGGISGIRATVGGWLDSDARFGIEASGFLLETKPVHFSASSVGGGAPLISIPFFASVPFSGNSPGETALNAGNAPNTVSMNATSQLWGAEVNNLLAIGDKANNRLALLFGVRFIQLDEGLTLNDTFNDTATTGTVSVTDTFHTRNQFYGFQLGLKGGTNVGALTLDWAVKCAVGVDYELSDVAGTSAVTGSAFGLPLGTFPEGVFAQTSNAGRQTKTPFAVMPELQLQLGYALTSHMRAVIGYDFLYLSDVLRPGEQIDRVVNPTQNVLFGGTGGVTTGTPSPLPAAVRSDYWVQGLNFGLQVRY